METPDYIIDCKVLCFPTSEDEEREKAKTLGMKFEGTEAWFPFVFDLREVIAIRQVADDLEAIKENECCIFTTTTNFTIDRPYKEIREHWIQLLTI